METPSHGIVSRFTARIGKRRASSPAERKMQRREQDRAYWASWQSSPSQLVEIHAMYAQEIGSSRH